MGLQKLMPLLHCQLAVKILVTGCKWPSAHALAFALHARAWKEVNLVAEMHKL